MAPISLKKGRVDELAKELVLAVTDLEDGSENSNTALEFAVSNFRFHRFLDVNSLNVTRKLDGLRNKFIVHCQDNKANQLESLKGDYLGKPFSATLFEVNTEYHFGVLSLFLSLSESPVNCGDVLKSKHGFEDPQETIDWKEYLLAGEEKLELGIAISEEQRLALEEVDNDEEYCNYSENDTNHDKGFQEAELTTWNVESSYTTFDHEAREDAHWLQHNIISQYWKGETTYPSTLNRKEMFAGDCHVMNVVQVPSQDFKLLNYLTENAVVRETLWMLQGIKSTFLYRYTDSSYSVRDDISLSHISKTMMKNSLEKFAAAGSKVHILKTFVTDALDLKRKNLKISRAFAYAVNCFLKRTRKELGDIEYQIVSKDQVFTILTLEQEVEGLLSEVDLVYQLYKSCVLITEVSEMAPSDCLMHITNSLFHTVCTLDSFGRAGTFQVCVVIPIFLETIRPFLSDLVSWISNGQLPIVGGTEFFIYEDEVSSEDDSEAWRKHFCIRTCQNDDAKLTVPHFLEDLTDKILLTGKSCRVLKQAGNSFADQESAVCEAELFKSVLEGLGVSYEGNAKEGQAEFEEVLMTEKSMVVLCDGFNQLLQENFLVIFQRNYERFIDSDKNHQATFDIQSTVEKSKLSMSEEASCRPPFSQIFKSSLQALINARYSQVSNALLKLLKDRFKFMHHFGIIKNFFLMEAGDVMSSFYSEIFTKIRHKELWKSTSYLTSVLHDALLLRFPGLVDKLTAGIKSDPRGSSQNFTGIQSAASIYLRYDMDWPLTIIFDSKAEEKYNAIFSFLLQVKRAVWSLEQLRIAELRVDTASGDWEGAAATSVAPESHLQAAVLRQEMFVLRVKLLHFVQSFHVYIMTRILHSSGLEFKAQASKAEDFDEILTIHLDFLEKVYDRCLLSPKVGFAKEAITRILSLCLNFQSCWDLGLANINGEDVASIDREFTKCSHFIQSFLNNLIKRGSFPHLELLSLSLKA